MPNARRQPRATLLAEHDFRRSGDAAPADAHGFSFAEPDGVWLLGHESGFALHVAGADDGAILELELCPYTDAARHPVQNGALWVNGQEIARFAQRGEATLAFALPGRHAQLAISLQHPDAASPAAFGPSPDTRKLAFKLRRARVFAGLPAAFPKAPAPDGAWQPPLARPPLPASSGGGMAALGAQIQALTGLPPHDLMMQFESLGWNCELGIAQRATGAEPLGLLRFAATPMMGLLAALDDGLEAVAAPTALQIAPARKLAADRPVLHRDYGIKFVLPERFNALSAKAALREAARHLAFQRRLFLETAADAGKLFVVHAGPGGMPIPAAHAVLHRLRGLGANALLFVVPGSAAEAGGVETIEPGLYRGYVQQFAPAEHVLSRTDVPAWLSLCANAYRLWREAGGRSWHR